MFVCFLLHYTQAQILDTFVKIHKGKYGNIHVVASLAAALSQYHDVMGTKLVDTLLRNIVNGLEANSPPSPTTAGSLFSLPHS